MENTKLTSVKLLENLYGDFKKNTVNSTMTLQKLTNRSIDLYLSDVSFKETIELHDRLAISSSKL